MLDLKNLIVLFADTLQVRAWLTLAFLEEDSIIYEFLSQAWIIEFLMFILFLEVDLSIFS